MPYSLQEIKETGRPFVVGRNPGKTCVCFTVKKGVN